MKDWNGGTLTVVDAVTRQPVTDAKRVDHAIDFVVEKGKTYLVTDAKD